MLIRGNAGTSQRREELHSSGDQAGFRSDHTKADETGFRCFKSHFFPEFPQRCVGGGFAGIDKAARQLPCHGPQRMAVDLYQSEFPVVLRQNGDPSDIIFGPVLWYNTQIINYLSSIRLLHAIQVDGKHRVGADQFSVA